MAPAEVGRSCQTLTLSLRAKRQKGRKNKTETQKTLIEVQNHLITSFFVHEIYRVHTEPK